MARDNALPDYDLDDLVVVSPQKRNFQMFVTRRFISHYADSPYEEYSADLLVRYTKDDSLFIDVGAHYGYYSLLIGCYHPSCRIMSFEPVSQNFAVLKRNIELNGLKNVAAHQSAVSDKDGINRFHLTEASDNCGFHGHPLSSNLVEIEVETVCLDGLMKGIKDKHVTIKIDTEGHEICVLDGMKDALKNIPDLKMLIEFNPKCIIYAGFQPSDLLNKISKLGFDIYFILDDKKIFYRLDPDNIEQWHEFMQGYETSYLNIFCLKKKRSLNICFFSHTANLMGAERSLLELASELTMDYGALLTVVLPSEGPLRKELLNIGAAVLTVNYGWWCSWKHSPATEDQQKLILSASFVNVLRACRETIQKINPDIIMTNTTVIPWGAVAATLLGRPHAWFARESGDDFKFFQPFSEIKRIIADSSNIVFTNSETLKKVLFAGRGNKSIFPVYTHFDIAKETLPPAEREYFSRADGIKLIIAGAVIENKGQQEAVLAVKELVSRGKNAELIIIGPAEEEYLKALNELIDDGNLRGHVKILGWQENIYSIINQADILLVCSKFEAFGRVAAEAMMLKKPVIGTNSGGTAELIKQGYNGFLYEPGNYRQLADRIEYFIENKGKIKEFGDNGYTFAKKTFSKDKFGGEVYRKFSKLKGSPNMQSTDYYRFLNSGILYAMDIFDNWLKQKDSQISDAARSLADRDTQVKQLEVDTKDRDSRISQLENDLLSRDSRIKQLWSEILIQDQSLEQFRYDLQEKDRFIAYLQDGIVMKLMTFYNRVLNRILAPGTRLHRYYQLSFAGLKILVIQGPLSLYKKFRAYLERNWRRYT